MAEDQTSTIDPWETIDDLSHYIACVRHLMEGHMHKSLWFRGEADETWKLSPSLLRSPHIDGGLPPENHETNLTALFVAQGAAYYPNFPRSWLDRQVLAQHHGCPTRLLDWTESALFALYFAVCKLGKNEDQVDGSVYSIDPWALIDENIESRIGRVMLVAHRVQTEREEEALGKNGQCAFRAPVPVFPTHDNPRVAAQKGRFTLYDFNPSALEHYSGTILQRMRIPADRKELLFWQLKEAGVTATTLFPDLDALSKELRCHFTQGKDVGW